jgi:hypothetical protein
MTRVQTMEVFRVLKLYHRILVRAKVTMVGSSVRLSVVTTVGVTVYTINKEGVLQ